MNYGAKTLTTFSISALLILSASACSSPSNNTPPDPTNTLSSSTASPAVAGTAEFYDKQLDLQDEKTFSENNFLVLGQNSKFTVNAAGWVQEDKSKKQAASGERFHAFTFTSSLPQRSASNTAVIPKPSLEVDGKTVDISGQMFSGGTIVVSAPENAEIILNMEMDGVKQSMNLKTAERTSKGVGDVWYTAGAGQISDGNISKPVQIGGNTVTLKASFSDPVLTAYSADSKLGWAENGTKAWLIVSYVKPEWDVPGNAIPKNQSSTLGLIDSKGKSYAPINLEDSNGDTQVAFLVPETERSFTMHTENSADIDDFGKVVASTGNVVLDQPKITFEAIKESK